MPQFTIETTYRLPVFRHGTYVTDTADAACRLAVEDDDWSAQKEDLESAGETYVTGVWDGPDAAYRGTALPVPAHFEETVQRKAAHLEILLGLLKIFMSNARAGQPASEEWLSRADGAVGKAEAILAGARGPDDPPVTGGPS